MKILILGANGFIGHHLIKSVFENTDWQVSAIDLDSSNLAQWGTRLNFHQGDVFVEREWIQDQISQVDVVMPLVAIPRPKFYVKEPIRVFELVFEENLRIVRDCVRLGKRLIFPSTSEVYGMCQEAQFNEDHSSMVFGPTQKDRWMYAGSKQLLDRLIWAYGREGLDFTIFRPFNWIGPNLDNIDDNEPGNCRVITQFLGHLLRHEPVSLVNGGAQQRCFTDIRDGIDALMRILKNPEGSASGKIFNVGNPHNESSIKDVAQSLVEILSQYPGYEKIKDQAQLQSVAAKEYYGKGYEDTEKRKPDISNISECLGWQPHVTLDEALKDIVGYYMSRPLAKVMAAGS